ncbi:MAG: GNAT family N-acetyltransferase [Elusimicrobiota bacterium]|nr:MAG: GNAT family N-acetyltransferase [Elusimicrobiota bacterium]
MNNLPELVVRADAGPRIGSGHLLRGLALALAWKKLGGKAAVAGERTAAHDERLAALGIEGRPASADSPAPGGWLAVDGYDFDPAYLDAAKSRAKLLVVDDHGHRPRLSPDVVLNPNAGCEDFPYAPSDALVLAGPRWALLRPEFAAEPVRRARGKKPKVLVTLGGADADNVTEAVLTSLAPMKGEIDVVCVVGPDNPHGERLKTLASDLRRGVSDLRALMLDCDAAVVAGGVTSLECAAAALPAVVIAVADNQKRQAKGLAAAGAAVEASASDAADALRSVLATSRMGAAGRALVDGKGAERAAGVLAALSKAKLGEADALLRPAQAGDVWPVWRLANAPSVRAHSFSAEPIPSAVHAKWFAAQLSDAKTRFYVLEVSGAHAAQVRVDREAEVHFAVASAFRGKGLGTLALKLSRTRAAEELGCPKLKALVIEPNEASARAFLGAGYARAGSAKEKGRDCAVFEATC